MPLHSFVIDIVGPAFSIQTDEDPQYLAELVKKLKNRIQELETLTGTKDPLKLSLLANLTLMDERDKLEHDKVVNDKVDHDTVVHDNVVNATPAGLAQSGENHDLESGVEIKDGLVGLARKLVASLEEDHSAEKPQDRIL